MAPMGFLKEVLSPFAFHLTCRLVMHWRFGCEENKHRLVLQFLRSVSTSDNGHVQLFAGDHGLPKHWWSRRPNTVTAT